MSADIRMRFEKGELLHPYVPTFARVFLHGTEGIILCPGCFVSQHKSDGRLVVFERVHEVNGFWFVPEAMEEICRRNVISQMAALRAAYDWCVRKARLGRDGSYFMFTPGTPRCVRRAADRCKPNSWWFPEFVKGRGALDGAW